jgi:putative Holliday junction resolvase
MSTPASRPEAAGVSRSSGRLLGIDFGERRIGLAVSDPTRLIASPAGAITRRPGKRVPVSDIVLKIQELEVTGIVLGLPLDANGDELPRAAEVRRLAEQLTTRTGLPTELVDERYSTAAALRRIREMGGKTRGRKADVDALAAAMLLQGVLDGPR